VHVDGAFGLWARACPARASQADGYELADSWATDAHKWFNVPYDCGVAMVKDEAALRAAMAMTAAYLPPSGVRDPMHYSADGSRRARGVDVWAALAFLGRRGLADLVEGCCRHAARMASGLAAAGHEVLNEVALNQVLVAFGDDERTARVIAAVQAAGVCWCGGTRWQGREAMRISVSSYATTDADIDASLTSILACAATPNQASIGCYGPSRYSVRNATSGSTRVARRAGIQQAAAATASSATPTSVNVIGSVAPTPNSRLWSDRLNANAPARPSARPTSAGRRC
jgi:glutamate/tyrosine decarboxylase-like PLP-dependent enzyme